MTSMTEQLARVRKKVCEVAEAPRSPPGNKVLTCTASFLLPPNVVAYLYKLGNYSPHAHSYSLISSEGNVDD